MPLGSGQDHRLFLRHGLQGGAGHTHKQLTGGRHRVYVGTGTGQHHTGAAHALVDLLRSLLELGKAVAATGNEHMDAGIGLVQPGRQLDELPGGMTGRLIQPADMADNHPVAQAKLLPHRLSGHVRRKLIGVDSVDGKGDVLHRYAIFPDQIVPDVLAHRQGTLTPVGQQLQHTADLKDAVAGGDKGKFQASLQGAAQESWNAGVGMDDIRLFLAQDIL